MSGEVNVGSIKDLKEGRYVVIDGEPCRVMSIDFSKSGKHGAAKARVEAMSLFTGNKKTLLKPGDASCDIPVVERRNAQVIAVLGNGKLQLMDLETYENYEIECPPELQAKAQQGVEVEVQDVMGKKTILRVKGV